MILSAPTCSGEMPLCEETIDLEGDLKERRQGFPADIAEFVPLLFCVIYLLCQRTLYLRQRRLESSGENEIYRLV